MQSTPRAPPCYEIAPRFCLAVQVFTARWRVLATVVGIAQFLTMNMFAYDYTSAFAGYDRPHVVMIFLMNTVASATVPVTTPLFLMLYYQLTHKAVRKGMTRTLVESSR